METLLVSLTIAGVLVYMFVQYSSISDNYQRFYRYNSVEGVYKAGVIKKFMLETGTEALFTALDSGVVEINGSSAYFSDGLWSQLSTSLGLSKMYLMKVKDSVDIKEEIGRKDSTFRAFLDTIAIPKESAAEEDIYVLVAKYNDKSFSSIAFTRTGLGV